MHSLLMHHHHHSSNPLITSLPHFYAYDMNLRPTIIYDDPPLENPVEELPSATFHQLYGFWPGQFEEIVSNLVLVPDQVVCPSIRCQLGFFK